MKRLQFDHFRVSRALPHSPVIHWLDQSGARRHSRPDRSLQTAGLERALPARGPSSFHGKRNLEGHYWFAQLRKHVWFESGAEKHALMTMDFAVPTLGIAAQPMHIAFENGRSHTPDFFLLRDDSHGVVIDVHAQGLTSDNDADKFRRTAAVCGQIGWTYLLVDDIPTVQRRNLEFLASYRQPECRPTPGLRSELLEYLRAPKTIAAVNTRFGKKSMYPGVLYHLLWQRDIEFDITQNLSDASTVKTALSEK